jgi:hypothetical protein
MAGPGLNEAAPPATIDDEQEGTWTEATPRDPSAGG